ncbi:NADP-dependent oxidoreductase domain-containing protein [Mucidula mucida]|nr:NADP-dependent oxidoreductase domain-containing protein [Mucidula mucida]
MSSINKKIPYVKLGNSGLKVSQIILGCAIYGTPEWYDWVKGEEESMKDIKAAYDLGINTFDTADTYSNGLSEVVVGKAIRAYNLPRDGIVIMTKVLNPISRDMNVHLHGSLRAQADELGYVNQHGLHRKHIFDAIKGSLERLQLDYVDVFQCHGFDDDTPIAETMQALHEVVQLGYARHIGMSTCRAWQVLHAMQSYAISNNLTPFIIMQNNYNLLYREDEHEMMPTLKYLGVSAIPWSTLARGALITTLEDQEAQPDDRIPGGRKQWHGKIIQRVEELAKKRDISIAQVAIAWSISRPGVTALIISPPSSAHLAVACAALHETLSEAEVHYLDELYQPQRPITNRFPQQY